MRRLTYLLAILATVLSTALIPAAASASGHHGNRKCASVQPEAGFYEGGRVGTEVLTVPDSRCRTISVSHIVDPANPSDRCQTFLVGFYPPVDGSLTYTEPVTACGRQRTVLARNVPDGTEYIVLYDIDYLEQRIHFRVHH
ncbi:hypothetical protein GCM10010112_84610 [Actinoplanes lobatus]|uniref:Uncharacterized protein n=1 Tax=Actinoplanes lobatus TaxID=113568 RepID=A0A7W7HKS3_9ACTN|nr:hypothetical protein [Actinoplanes lobatus]MBB4752363.1 hypothetical protein [Actinoplanes lobatus]GGN94881.1 hypothetical protein GCM10010112_84610 [Actinoplanes lobatus]GIE45591.1 hypothetical protein Alo02nite_84890 [Actinoplanes lobatus]